MSIINIKDYKNNHNLILNLLNNLTESPEISKSQYDDFIKSLQNNHNIFLYIIDGIPVGIITILHEKKLIHDCKSVLHIEDLVVDPLYRNNGVAQKLINYCIEYGKKINCYKIILDCKEYLKKFY